MVYSPADRLNHPARLAAAATIWLLAAGLAAAGCGQTAEVPSLDQLQKQANGAGSGGASGTPSSGTGGNSVEPANATAAADAVPTATKCTETKQDDGTVCLVCYDPTGKEIKRDCGKPGSPGPNTGCGPAPADQPGVCKVYEDKGAQCAICTDGKGNEISRACAAPGMPANQDPGPVTCTQNSYPDGTVCTVCSDGKGNVLKKGCTAPAPEPPMPSMVVCKDYDQNGAKCVVCYDGAGQVVKQGCSQPANPGPGMMPPPPKVDCRTFKDKTSVCIVCTDESGTVVKQECHANAP
jgi:hypothetical protein